MNIGDLVITPDPLVGRIRGFVQQTMGAKKLLAWVEVGGGERRAYDVDELTAVPATSGAEEKKP